MSTMTRRQVNQQQPDQSSPGADQGGQEESHGGDFHQQAGANGNAWAQQQLGQGGEGGGQEAEGGQTHTMGGGGGGVAAAAPPPSDSAPSGGGGSGGGGGSSAPSGGGGGGGGGASAPPDRSGAAAEQAAPTPEPVQGASVVELMSNFTAATPTTQAVSWPGLGSDLGGLAQQESADFNASVPELHAVLEGEDAEGGDGGAIDMPTTDGQLEGEDAAPPPEPEMAPTPELGPYQAPTPRLTITEAAEGEEANPANQQAVADAIDDVSTRDPSISGDPGPEPQVPLVGQTDPQRMQTQVQGELGDAEQARADASQAILDSPGAERVQPMVMDEPYAMDGLNEAAVGETAAAPDMEEYLALGMPADVTGSFDEMYGPEMQASMAQAQAQVDGAATERDTQQQAELDRAQTEAADLVSQAQSDQEAEVTEQRRLIEDERQATIQAQREAVAQVDADVRAEHGRVDAEVRNQIRTEQARIDQEFANAEREANAEIAQGEAEAAQEKREAEEESQNRSWWQKAFDFIADCISALTEVISDIFDAVREAVSAILDAVKELAAEIIDAVCSFICDAIAAFGEFLKAAIQTLLGEIFPELADALCAFVDDAVEYAQETVQQLAEDLKAGIEALCDMIEGALNAILDVFQAAIDTALAFAQALITGDWTQILLKVLEAALRLCGISPDEFYAFVGRAENTIETIVNDPGGFLSNCIEAVGLGFSQFGDNFLTHLQTGFIEWMTGKVGEAGIVMPAQLDVAGVFSIVAQVMGLTRENLRGKVEEHFGDNAARAFDMTWELISTLVDGGMEGLWAEVSSNLDGLWDMVIGQIQQFLAERVVMAAIAKIATMWNPVGAIVQALITAWNVYQWVQAQAQRIFGIIRAVVDGIGDIASGAIGGAANMIEGAIAGMVPVGIDLLANLIGLGGLGAKIREIIEQVQGWVNEAIDSMIERLKGMFSGGSDTDSANSEEEESDGAPGDLGDGEVGERVNFSADEESHTLWLQVQGSGVEVMVASNPSPVTTKLDDWASRTDEVAEEDRARATSLIGEARTKLSTTQSEGDEAAAAKQAAEQGAQEGGGEFEAQDNEAEAAERTLAQTLSALFTLYGEEDQSLELILQEKVTAKDASKIIEHLLNSTLTAEDAENKSVAELVQQGRQAWRGAAGDEPFVRQAGAAVAQPVPTRKLGEIDNEHQAAALAQKGAFFLAAANGWEGAGDSGDLYEVMKTAASPYKGIGEQVTFGVPELHRVEGADGIFKYNVPMSWKQDYVEDNGGDGGKVKGGTVGGKDDPETALAFAGWLQAVDGGGGGVGAGLVEGSLRNNVWWTPDERANMSKSTSQGIDGDDKFFELCRISALAPEWYAYGFISFHVPIGDSVFRRPTVWDGMMSPLWVQQTEDDFAATGGGAPEVINESNIDTGRCRINANVVTQDLSAALQAVKGGTGWTDDRNLIHSGPTPEDQMITDQQTEIADLTDANRASADARR